MFPWNIAKSAEAMASRFFIKKICKFLLKKKLGQFILGEIDIDQLDIQLSAGVIQLSDLALNVDYLNHELQGAAPLIVKVGSIRSLSVKMPWNGEGCHIEIDELELELGLAHIDNSGLCKEGEPCDLSQDKCLSTDMGKYKHPLSNDSIAFTATGVHEGVKAVANVVKSLLTSFRVKIKNAIVAFDPRIENYEEKTRFHNTLVLRITEIECGTHISGDSSSNGGSSVGNFLQISCLTNFLKFRGVSFELLHMSDHQNQAPGPSAPQAACGPTAAITILTGENDGVSGTLSLSLPWKNGSLEIRKVDADAVIDPVKVSLEINIIEWFLKLWSTLENYNNSVRDNCGYNKNTDFADHNSMSSYYSSSPGSPMRSTDKVMANFGIFPTNLGSPSSEELAPDMLLQESHLISDWVPSPVREGQKDAIEEAGLGASLDQFFECFDGMRSSQSLLGNSGMWNWTCSVFSVITAASNLASGSSHFPAEQQHVETNLKVTFAEVSVAFSFFHKDWMDLQDHSDVCSTDHYFSSRWIDIHLSLQVCPKEWKLEATVKNIVLDDCFDLEENAAISGTDSGVEGVASQTFLIQRLQDEVQSALPSISASLKVFDSRVENASFVHSPFGLLSTESLKGKTSINVVKASVLKTCGVTDFQLRQTSKSSDGCFTGPTSFSLKLPSFLLWVNLNSLNELLKLLGRVQSSCGTNHSENDLLSGHFNEEKKSSGAGNANHRSRLDHGASSLKGDLHGDIIIPNARVTFCFPLNRDRGFRSYLSSDQFITLDFSSAPTCEGQGITLMEESLPTSFSLHLNIAAVEIYLITVTSKHDDNDVAFNLKRPRFSSHRVLSLKYVPGHPSVISVHCPKNVVAGSWIKKKAKILATSDDFGSKHTSVEKGYEFVSVATRKVTKDLHSQTRKEMLLGSEFLLHIHLSSVVAAISSEHYSTVCWLLNQVLELFSSVGGNSGCSDKQTSEGQRSILLDCDALEICANLDLVNCTKNSLQIELPGSWNSLKLNVHNLQLLSVSNTGCVRGSSFFWLSHAEGKLLGSVSSVPGHEFLLLLCSNSSKGRGNGEGSNVLSCRDAGSDIMHLWDPEDMHSFMSIALRCVTIVAPGGRLDWVDSICAFFRLPSSENLSASTPRKEDCQDHGIVGCSFTVTLLDAALSYEPILEKPEINHGSSLKCNSFVNADKETCEPVVACLLAASFCKLSNKISSVASDAEHSIKIQDVGLLLNPTPKVCIGDYGLEYLRKTGYTKVADEALLLAVLRINSESGSWELNCSESHVLLSTCHDTTLGLMRLASQLQQLFSPDVEESLVHLQNRWDNVQLLKGKSICRKDAKIVPPLSKVKQNGAQMKRQVETVGSSDMVYEDVFHPVADCERQLGCHGPDSHVSADAFQYEDSCNFTYEGSESSSEFVGGSALAVGLEGHCTSILQDAELMESYCLSDLHPLTELTWTSQPNLHGISQDIRRGSGGWYPNTSLEIVENHISDVDDSVGQNHFVEEKLISTGCNNSERFKGRILLNNLNVKWEMFSGSDWHELWPRVQHSDNESGRDKNVCLELVLSDFNIQYDIFPDGSTSTSKLRLSVKDCGLYDKSRMAPWKQVLGYYYSKAHPRSSSSKALKLVLEAVRPDMSTPLEEYRLNVAVCPLLLHLHQSQLDFLIAFFGGRTTSLEDPVSSNTVSSHSGEYEGSAVNEEALLPFFQKFDIRPTVLRVDYRPSRVDLAALSAGKYAELVNIVPWKGVKLDLKHVQSTGVYGWEKVFEIVLGDWLEDISQNQIHKLLQGLPTIRSLVAVSSGAAKLVSLPVRSYYKDRRLLKSLQRGTLAFLRSISVEAVGLGVHLAGGAHDILLHAEYMLTCLQPSIQLPAGSELKTNVRSDQPTDAQQGLQKACQSLSDGLGRTASALIRSPLRIYQRGNGASSALATAVRGAPAAVIAPASAAAEAVHCALLGVRNSLDPEHKKESINKYSGSSHP